MGGAGAKERRGQGAGKFQTIERRGPAAEMKAGLWPLVLPLQWRDWVTVALPASLLKDWLGGRKGFCKDQ